MIKPTKKRCIKKQKKSKLYFSEQQVEDYFDYATSIREETCNFIEGKIPGSEWLKVAYYKPTRIIIKRLLRKHGIKKTRHIMKVSFQRAGYDTD